MIQERSKKEFRQKDTNTGNRKQKDRNTRKSTQKRKEKDQKRARALHMCTVALYLSASDDIRHARDSSLAGETEKLSAGHCQ